MTPLYVCTLYEFLHIGRIQKDAIECDEPFLSIIWALIKAVSSIKQILAGPDQLSTWAFTISTEIFQQHPLQHFSPKYCIDISRNI